MQVQAHDAMPATLSVTTRPRLSSFVVVILANGVREVSFRLESTYCVANARLLICPRQ
jgi:hypothetical protein